MRKCCTVRIYIYMPTRQRRNSLSAWHLSIRACQHHHYRFAGTYIQTHTHTQPKIAVYLVPKRKKESMTQLTKAIDWRRIFFHSCEYSQQHRNIHTYTYGLVIFVIFIIIVVSQSLLAAAAATAAETCTNSHSHTNTLAPQQ